MFTTGIRAGVFINQEHFAVFQSWQQIFCDILSLLVIIMFIETLEFTIPVDLCDLFSSLKRGPRSNMEFPASVNSYGTTQDANIQVLLRANKLTFKVDGVSSNSSMISKSECKTLKLSVFDVDCNVAAEEELNTYRDIVSQNAQYSNPVKRTREYSVSESPQPPAKSSRNSFSDSSSKSRSIPQQSPRSSNQNQSKSHNDTPVNIKQEPEDPDLIEIEPDDIVPKKETPYMQIDYSSDVPHTQTSQAALERLSHPQSSHSHSPASSSSSFHQNVPHVQDYSEPGPSQSHHGDQSADDFLVFQDDDGDENEADYSNDDIPSFWHSQSLQALKGRSFVTSEDNPLAAHLTLPADAKGRIYPCPHCGKVFTNWNSRYYHIKAIHERVSLACVCGKAYNRRPSLLRHQKLCGVMLQFRNMTDVVTVPNRDSNDAETKTEAVPQHETN